MAVYKNNYLLTVFQVCDVCSKEKPIKKFVWEYYKPTDSYYADKKCSTCKYLAKRKKYEDRQEDYLARQRHKELYTIDGRALLLRNRCKQRSRRDGIHFNLSKQIIIDKLKTGKCEITGIDFYFGELCLHPFAPSIDKINPKLGYIDDNIRVVCMIYNFCKNEFSDEQVNEFIYRASCNMTLNK